MAKLVCESCGTSFLPNVVRELENCPVCGKSLWDEKVAHDGTFTYDKVEKIDLENPDMYFYDIEDEEDEEDEELREVWCQCIACREINTIPCNQFTLIKTEYVKLKDSVEICCKGCGKPVNNLVIPKRPDGWRKRDMWVKDYKNIPKCPICSSTKIHKISMTNKAASALVFGVLSAGHVSKTYKCDTCGAKF